MHAPYVQAVTQGNQAADFIRGVIEACPELASCRVVGMSAPLQRVTSLTVIVSRDRHEIVLEAKEHKLPLEFRHIEEAKKGNWALVGRFVAPPLWEKIKPPAHRGLATVIGLYKSVAIADNMLLFRAAVAEDSWQSGDLRLPAPDLGQPPGPRPTKEQVERQAIAYLTARQHTKNLYAATGLCPGDTMPSEIIQAERAYARERDLLARMAGEHFRPTEEA